MDSEHWISRLAAAKRFYAAQLGHSDRAGMEELDMDEEVRPEFACPYCYEDHDVGSLCAHLEEEHPFEPQAALVCVDLKNEIFCGRSVDSRSIRKPVTRKLTNRHLEKKGFKFDPKNEHHCLWTSERKHQFWKEHNNSVSGACPVCSEMVTKDMINHITMQHGYLFKNRRRLRRFIIPGSQALSLLSRDLREAHLQLLLGGGHRPSNNNSTTNISADPLLSTFGLSFPTSDAEQTSKSTISIPDDATMLKETPIQARKLSIDSSLTSEEREQKRKQASVRAAFVQDLLLSTLFGD